MGFFNSFDKIDGAVNRGYARWGKWIWGALLLPVVIYFCWSIWAAIWGPPSGAVKLVIHSQIDRPIRGFSVNGVAGANAFAYGGGGATCCGSISGNKAEIIWTVDYTMAQYKSGKRARRQAAQSQPNTGTSCAPLVPVSVIVRLITHLYSGLVNRKWLCVYPSRT